MRTLYNDILGSATLSSFNTIGGSAISSLIDPRLSRYASFSYAGGITINATFVTDVTFSSIGLAGHTLSDNVTIAVNNSPPEVLGKLGTGFVSFDTPVTGTDFTIVLTDIETNDGEIIEIGRLMFGDVYTMPGINDNVSSALVDTSRSSFSASRQVYGESGAYYARISVQLPVVEPAEKEELEAMKRVVGSYKPFILDFDEECFDEGPFYCVLTSNSMEGFSFNDAHFWTVLLTYEEVF